VLKLHTQFWNVTPCSLLHMYRRFVVTAREDKENSFLLNGGI